VDETYTITLSRGQADGARDWVDVSITTASSGLTINAGRIKIERNLPAEPVTFPTTFDSEMVLYSYNVDYGPDLDPPMVDYEDLPSWAFEVWYQVGGADPSAAVSSYNLDEDGLDFDNIEFQGRDGRIFVGVGKDVGRCSPEGELVP
jgi:hypothetical protein